MWARAPSLLVGLCLASCLPDPTVDRRFQCAGPDDSSCGEGCVCVASGQAEPAFWCECGGVTTPGGVGPAADALAPADAPPELRERWLPGLVRDVQGRRGLRRRDVRTGDNAF